MLRLYGNNKIYFKNFDKERNLFDQESLYSDK